METIARSLLVVDAGLKSLLPRVPIQDVVEVRRMRQLVMPIAWRRLAARSLGWWRHLLLAVAIGRRKRSTSL
jgi:hypothetical protein